MCKFSENFVSVACLPALICPTPTNRKCNFCNKKNTRLCQRAHFVPILYLKKSSREKRYQHLILIEKKRVAMIE